MTDHDPDDAHEPGPDAGTDTTNAAETTNADELLGDIAEGAGEASGTPDDPGRGAD